MEPTVYVENDCPSLQVPEEKNLKNGVPFIQVPIEKFTTFRVRLSP
jgi:hypothetical protein